MTVIQSPPREVVKPKVICGPGRTKQSFKDEVDINKIIKKHARTGMITHVNKKQPFYGDVSSIGSYQESLEIVRNAEELFGNMSAEIRNRFNNEPQEMIDFLANPANKEEAIKLGMILEENKEVIETPPPPQS